MKVLVVEDDDFSAQVISGILRNLGFELVRGRNGSDAIRLLVEPGNSIQVVFSDVYMPEMNGLDLFRTLKFHPTLSTTPVVLMSGLADLNLVSAAVKMGCSHFLVKPVSREKIQAKLRELISMKRSWLKNPKEVLGELEINSNQLLSMIERFYSQVFRFLEEYNTKADQINLPETLKPLVESAVPLGTDDLKESLATYSGPSPVISEMLHNLEQLLNDLEALREKVAQRAREEAAMAILVTAEERRRAKQSEMLDEEVMSVAGRLVRRTAKRPAKGVIQAPRMLSHDMLVAAKAGDPQMQFDVALAYMRGYGTPVNEEIAVDWLQQAAEKKHLQALVRMGLLALQTTSVNDEKAREEARDYFTRAAQKNSIEGKYWLQQLTNEPASLEYLHTAKLGDPEAQCELGLLYEEFVEFEANFLEAAFWFGLSAKQGFVESMFHLGLIHLEERIAGTSKWDAANFFRAAAELAHVDAQYWLARMLNLALGISLDINQAIIWYEKAARQGHIKAQYELAHVWETAAGMKPNTKEALRWYLVCADSGSPSALQKVAELRKYLPPAEITEAENHAQVTLSSINSKK